MNTDNNGSKPAFPILDPNGSYYETGMTKREAFAMAAMQGILAGRNPDGDYPVDEVAIWAVQQADELLKQLSQ